MPFASSCCTGWTHAVNVDQPLESAILTSSKGRRLMRDSLISFVAGLSCATVIALWFAPRHVERPSQSSPAVPEVATVLTPLFERLVTAIEALEPASLVTGQPAERLVPEGGATTALVARVAALERQLAQRRGGTAHIASGLANSHQQATRYEAVRRFAAELISDNAGAAVQQRVLLKTPAELLRMFGMPTSCGVSQAGHMSWHWHDPQSQNGFGVQFVNGYAVM